MAACAAAPKASDVDAAWAAWADGDVEEAERLARGAGTDPARHLLFQCASVCGRYEEALGHHSRIGASYARRAEIDGPVVHAYAPLGRLADAASFARERKLPIAEILAHQASRPLQAHLEGVAEIPFAAHPYAPYIPGFAATLEGQSVVAHIDAGGTYLHMSPARAKKLGIELVEGGEGIHADKKVRLSHGIAREFRLGAARFENVPVVAIPTLTGGSDILIFGTNLLEPFLVTVDYPRARMILSRGARDRQLDMLPKDRVEVPFHLWGDP